MFIDYAAVTLIMLLSLMSPGPDFVVVTQNTVRYSRRVGLWTSIGIALGVALHITYCILGIAVIISKSVIAFNIIKYAGAAYICYLGIKSLLAKREIFADQNNLQSEQLSDFKAFWSGLLCNALNPKATLFFLSLFTVVITPETPLTIQMLMGGQMVVFTLVWFSLVALFLSSKPMKKIMSQFQYYLSKVTGVTFLLLGIKLATFSRS